MSQTVNPAEALCLCSCCHNLRRLESVSRWLFDSTCMNCVKSMTEASNPHSLQATVLKEAGHMYRAAATAQSSTSSVAECKHHHGITWHVKTARVTKRCARKPPQCFLFIIIFFTTPSDSMDRNSTPTCTKKLKEPLSVLQIQATHCSTASHLKIGTDSDTGSDGPGYHYLITSTVTTVHEQHIRVTSQRTNVNAVSGTQFYC